MNKTIDYYDSNSQEFFESTVGADMSNQYRELEKYLHKGDKVLDLGCGSGRDSKYFIEKGYSVTAIDGAKELCKLASEHTGIKVRNMMFDELDYENEFDGIWACASLLHVDADNIVDVFKKVKNALKPDGVLYASFKYGSYSGERNGRFFTDLDEEAINQLVKKVGNLSIIKVYLTEDVRPERAESWLNVLVRKK